MRTAREELGPYRILRKIAVGGMAEIYLARQRGIEGLERTVVLKQILEKHEQNEEFVTMFLDEARLMAALSHPNIAQVLDLARADDTHYLVMEYVRGPTLGAMLSAAQRAGARGVPETPALGIALAIAEALHYVHERRDDLGRPLGIVHRDLNPSNVLVSYDGAVKLIDFGIAKAATKVYETRTGVIKGTYGYIAPEALTGRAKVDRRADVFALGILLYELLVGKHPYDVSDEPNLLDRILEARYKRPREVRPDLPIALDRVIARCLAPHPEGRPASMAELITDLSGHMKKAGIVPTALDLAAIARQLVPDAEGPQPLRRPSSVEPRPVFPREGVAKDGGTRKVSSFPPGDGDPTQRALPRIPGDEGTRKIAVRAAAPVPAPEEPVSETIPVPVIDALAAIAGPKTLPETLAMPPADPDLDDDGATLVVPARPSRSPSPPSPPPSLSPSPPPPPPPPPSPSLSPSPSPSPSRPPPPLHPSPDVPPAPPPPAPRRGIHPALAALGLLLAGVAAFAAARALGGRRADPELAVLPPVSRAIPPDASPASAPIPRALHVVSDPPGAAITLDGIDLAMRTPAVIAIDARLSRAVVGVSLEGYPSQSRSVSTSAREARFVLEMETETQTQTQTQAVAETVTGDPATGPGISPETAPDAGPAPGPRRRPRRPRRR